MRDKYVHKSFPKLVKGYSKHTTQRPVNRWQIQGCQLPFCNSIFIIRPEKQFHPAREAISWIMKKSYICGQFIDLVECNIQDRIEGGATGEIAPGPPLQGGPPWWHLFVLNKMGKVEVLSTLFCIFNNYYFISSPNKLKICYAIKQLYVHNIMPKHENNALQKKFYNQFKKGTFLSSVPHAWAHSTWAWGTPDRSIKSWDACIAKEI